MAHKKAAGAARINRDSVSKRRGVKEFGNHWVKPGQILVRQLGTKFHPGLNVKRTADDTLIALASGVVQFTKRKVLAFSGNLVVRKFVHVIPTDSTTAKITK